MQNINLTEKRNIVKHENLLLYGKMIEEIITFGEIEILK